MTVNPIDRDGIVEKLRRLNELERVVPIYRAALERIADTALTLPGAIDEARHALREADRDQ